MTCRIRIAPLSTTSNDEACYFAEAAAATAAAVAAAATGGGLRDNDDDDDAPHREADVAVAAAAVEATEASDMCCFYMPVLWVVSHLQCAAGEKCVIFPQAADCFGFDGYFEVIKITCRIRIASLINKE